MFKMDGDEIKINVYDLLHEYLPEERHQDLAESLSCSDAIIKHVTDQILEGWTASGFSGQEVITTNPENFLPLRKARRRIAEGSSEVAKKEIEKLQGELKRMEEKKNEYMKKYFHLIEINNRLTEGEQDVCLEK